jgi:hypothetical protein
MATLCLLLLRYPERQQTTFATGKLLTSFEVLRTQGRRRSLKAQGVLGPPAAISCDPALVCVTQASRAPRNATIQRISSKDCDVPGGKLGNISTCCETRPRRDGLFKLSKRHISFRVEFYNTCSWPFALGLSCVCSRTLNS